jgi:hypothetical protein
MRRFNAGPSQFSRHEPGFMSGRMGGGMGRGMMGRGMGGGFGSHFAMGGGGHGGFRH